MPGPAGAAPDQHALEQPRHGRPRHGQHEPPAPAACPARRTARAVQTTGGRPAAGAEATASGITRPAQPDRSADPGPSTAAMATTARMSAARSSTVEAVAAPTRHPRAAHHAHHPQRLAQAQRQQVVARQRHVDRREGLAEATGPAAPGTRAPPAARTPARRPRGRAPGPADRGRRRSSRAADRAPRRPSGRRRRRSAARRQDDQRRQRRPRPTRDLIDRWTLYSTAVDLTLCAAARRLGTGDPGGAGEGAREHDRDAGSLTSLRCDRRSSWSPWSPSPRPPPASAPRTPARRRPATSRTTCSARSAWAEDGDLDVSPPVRARAYRPFHAEDILPRPPDRGDGRLVEPHDPLLPLPARRARWPSAAGWRPSSPWPDGRGARRPDALDRGAPPRRPAAPRGRRRRACSRRRRPWRPTARRSIRRSPARSRSRSASRRSPGASDGAAWPRSPSAWPRCPGCR